MSEGRAGRSRQVRSSKGDGKQSQSVAASRAGDRQGAGAMQPKRRGATSTVEDYLKCVLVNEGAGDHSARRTVSMGTLGAALGVAPGTVTAMMKALGESGLVNYAPYTGVTLTNSGRKLATHVLRRHRLIELFLVDVMGLDWSEVHEEAELLEHAISDRLIERMDEMLEYPTVDPHGDPIPTSDGRVAEQALPSLLECPLNQRLEVVRVLDQSAGFLRGLESQGVVPGAVVSVLAREGGCVVVSVEGLDDGIKGKGKRAELAGEIAGKVVVQSS